jgi:D-glycero-D-manno-heptose 1,7-bisphosphate phosphatase
MKLIILDRDGVINVDSDAYIKNADEWKPIAGSLKAIAKLTQSGYHVVVATNQSGIGRGLFEMATLNAIHDKMHRAVSQAGGRIDAVFYCPHAQEANCACRKPRPGLLEDIARRFNTELKDVPSIGDSLRDLAGSGGGGRAADTGPDRQGRKDAGGRRPAVRNEDLQRPRHCGPVARVLSRWFAGRRRYTPFP